MKSADKAQNTEGPIFKAKWRDAAYCYAQFLFLLFVI